MTAVSVTFVRFQFENQTDNVKCSMEGRAGKYKKREGDRDKKNENR